MNEVLRSETSSVESVVDFIGAHKNSRLSQNVRDFYKHLETCGIGDWHGTFVVKKGNRLPEIQVNFLERDDMNTERTETELQALNLYAQSTAILRIDLQGFASLRIFPLSREIKPENALGFVKARLDDSRGVSYQLLHEARLA